MISYDVNELMQGCSGRVDQMEINQVECFLVLAEELHFGRASRRLYMTQPGLSRLVRALETELGESLFHRSTRSVKLTNAGEALLRPAKEFLDAHENALHRVARVGAGEAGRVRIGFAGASSHLLIARLVKEVKERYPGIIVELYSSNFADVGLLKIAEGDFDLSLGRWSVVPAGLGTRVIRNESFVVAVPIWHPNASDGAVRFGDLLNERFIHLPHERGSMISDRYFELTERYGVRHQAEQIAPDTWTALALVSAGVGVTLTLSTVRENVQFPGVVFLDLIDEVETAQLSLAWKEGHGNAAVDTVLRCADVALPRVE